MTLRHAFLLCLLLITAAGCSSLPQDEQGRRRVYERRLHSLEFPRQPRPSLQNPTSSLSCSAHGPDRFGLLTGSEYYRLDDTFVVEMSVVYKAVTGIGDYLNPAPTIGGQVRSILDASQSLENFMDRGTPEHPADIIQRARVLKRPHMRY